MIYDPTKYVDFLLRHRITPNQFLLCFLLYTDKEEDSHTGVRYYISGGPHMASLYRYAQGANEGHGWTSEDIDHLIKIGFIDPSSRYKDDTAIPDTLRLTEEFVDAIFAGQQDFEEFWDTYPGFVDNFQDSRGPKVILKAVDKDEIQELYNKRIRTRIAHEILMRSLKWAKTKGLINMRIDNFLKSEIWKELDKMQIKEGGVVENEYGM